MISSQLVGLWPRRLESLFSLWWDQYFDSEGRHLLKLIALKKPLLVLKICLMFWEKIEINWFQPGFATTLLTSVIVCHIMKKKKLDLFWDRKELAKINSSTKHFIATSFQEKALLVFDPDVFVLLSKVKPVGERLFCPLLFSLNIIQNDFPVTRNWPALHSKSFCLLLRRLCSVSRNFFPNGAISRKITKKSFDNGSIRKITKNSVSLLYGSVVYVQIRNMYTWAKDCISFLLTFSRRN